MATRNEMKQEAIRRMKALKMHQNPIHEFKEEGKLNASCNRMGILFWLEGDDLQKVRDWEKETGNMAYHVIHDNTEFGELLSVRFVSKYKEDWQIDEEDLQNGTQLAYVFNLTDEYCSEYGSIGIRPCFGGVVRVA